MSWAMLGNRRTASSRASWRSGHLDLLLRCAGSIHAIARVEKVERHYGVILRWRDGSTGARWQYRDTYVSPRRFPRMQPGIDRPFSPMPYPRVSIVAYPADERPQGSRPRTDQLRQLAAAPAQPEPRMGRRPHRLDSAFDDLQRLRHKPLLDGGGARRRERPSRATSPRHGGPGGPAPTRGGWYASALTLSRRASRAAATMRSAVAARPREGARRWRTSGRGWDGPASPQPAAFKPTAFKQRAAVRDIGRIMEPPGIRCAGWMHEVGTRASVTNITSCNRLQDVDKPYESRQCCGHDSAARRGRFRSRECTCLHRNVPVLRSTET